MITIDSKKCIKCRICETECPSLAISIDSFSIRHSCIMCGHCVAVCPRQAVKFNDSSVRKLGKLSVSPKDMIEVFKHNRSVRFYREKQVSEKIIRELIDAVKFYPSASNRRKTEITVLTDCGKIKKINDSVASELIKLCSFLSWPVVYFIIRVLAGRRRGILVRNYLAYFLKKREINENFICFNAPALFIFHSKGSHRSGDHEDSLIWAANTANLASSYGLGACFIGYITAVINRRKFRNLKLHIGVPSDHRIHAVLTIGYPANRFVNEIDRPEQKFTVL